MSLDINFRQINLATLKLVPPVVFKANRIDGFRDIEGDIKMIQPALCETAETGAGLVRKQGGAANIIGHRARDQFDQAVDFETSSQPCNVFGRRFENMYLKLRFPSPELGRIMTDIAANIDRKPWRMDQQPQQQVDLPLGRCRSVSLASASLLH